MKQCLDCRGVVPEALEACPNCAVAPRGGGLKVVAAAAGLVALVTSGCIATPVYGIPCTSRQLDGGNKGCYGACDTFLEDGGNPANDPDTGCVRPDGGTP